MTAIEDPRAEEDLTLSQRIAKARVMHSFLPDDDTRSKNEYVADELEAAGYRLTAPPTDDEREALGKIISETAFTKKRDVRGNFTGYSSFSDVADAILAASFRRQGPITRAVTERAWDVLIAAQDAGKNSHEAMRAALESARAVS